MQKIIFCDTFPFFPVFPGKMQNLTAIESNLSDSQCIQNMDSSIFGPTIFTYVMFSLPTNGWVLWLMVSSPLFWTDRMDLFAFQLVSAELLFVFLQFSAMIAFIHPNPTALKILITIAEGMLVARNNCQMSICVECFLAVVHPVLYLKYKPLRYRMSFFCLIWLQTVLIIVIQIHMKTQKLTLFTISVITFVYSFVVNSFCCLSVLRALIRPSPGEGEKVESSLIKKRAFNIVLTFQVITILSYVPQISVFVLSKKLNHSILCIFQALSYCLMVWLGIIYPSIYLCKAGKHLVIKDFCVNCFLK